MTEQHGCQGEASDLIGIFIYGGVDRPRIEPDGQADFGQRADLAARYTQFGQWPFGYRNLLFWLVCLKYNMIGTGTDADFLLNILEGLHTYVFILNERF